MISDQSILLSTTVLNDAMCTLISLHIETASSYVFIKVGYAFMYIRN